MNRRERILRGHDLLDLAVEESGLEARERVEIEADLDLIRMRLLIDLEKENESTASGTQ